MKSGSKTSEFWITLIVTAAPWVAALIVLIGIVAGTVDLEAGLVLLGVFGLGGAVGGGWASSSYSRGRAGLKAAELRAVSNGRQ